MSGLTMDVKISLVWNKQVIIGSKLMEPMYKQPGCRIREHLKRLNVIWVHWYAILVDNMSHVLHLTVCKETLL